MNRRIGKYLWAALAAAALVAVFFVARPAAPARGEEPAAPRAPAAEGASPRCAPAPAAEGRAAAARAAAPVPSAAAEDDGDASGDAEVDEETRRVDAFDALTDAWREPAAAKVTMPEIARFREQFNRLPPARKPECLQRALNLVPDENVMLLAGILCDKTQPAELLEDVFNDILKRDESVKAPVLQTIFKDKSHPCWADAAWILDVTGEQPAPAAPAEEAAP